MGKTTIVLVDDHHLVRQGLRSLLEGEDDFEVVGEAADGLAALTMAERLRPDVLVTDLMMPGLSGLDLTRSLGRHAPGTHVVVLTMHKSEAYVLEALKNGALGYVLKDSQMSDLMAAIRAAAAGRRYLSPLLSERAVEAYVEKAKASPPDAYDLLTDREREVLHLAAEGRTSAEIAAQLCISTRTVESHRASLLRKLGLRTPVDLLRYALRRGILSIDE